MWKIPWNILSETQTIRIPDRINQFWWLKFSLQKYWGLVLGRASARLQLVFFMFVKTEKVKGGLKSVHLVQYECLLYEFNVTFLDSVVESVSIPNLISRSTKDLSKNWNSSIIGSAVYICLIHNITTTTSSTTVLRLMPLNANQTFSFNYQTIPFW